MRIIFIILGTFGSLYSQETDLKIHDIQKEIIQSEYNFAEEVRNTSVRDGFLKFIAEDGILFRPGPVNGKEFLENSKAQTGLLLWYPTESIISSSFDFGVNTGPWELKRTVDEKASAFGQFLTVWEKKPDGTWKFLIDAGISHSKPEIVIEGIENSAVIDKFESLKEFEDILEIERNFNSAPASENFKSIVNSETTFLRNYNLPVKYEMKDEFLSQFTGTEKWETLGGKSSKANDIAYTYGKGIYSDGNSEESFYYVHVWRKEKDKWMLLFDLQNKIL